MLKTRFHPLQNAQCPVYITFKPLPKFHVDVISVLTALGRTRPVLEGRSPVLATPLQTPPLRVRPAGSDAYRFLATRRECKTQVFNPHKTRGARFTYHSNFRRSFTMTISLYFPPWRIQDRCWEGSPLGPAVPPVIDCKHCRFPSHCHTAIVCRTGWKRTRAIEVADTLQC